MTASGFCEKYYVERRGTDSLKWDALKERFGDPDLLSFWIADMEFKSPEAVREALAERVEHGVFGYSVVWESYYRSLADWELRRHGFSIEKSWVRFSPGLVTALCWTVNAFTEPGDAVLIMTPVYYPFHNVVKDNGRKLVRSELVNSGGAYAVDYDRFEKDAAESGAKLLIFCSPHNPAGRVWKAEELERILDICRRHGVLVISDEIHQDLVMAGSRHIPAASLGNGAYGNMVVTLNSASKTFNLAGLNNAHVIISDPGLREKYDSYVKTVNRSAVNVLGLIATEAAYRNGEAWLEGLLAVIESNYRRLTGAFRSKAPRIVVSPLEGTYLAWIDLRAYWAENTIKEHIQDRCRLAVDFGDWFGDGGKGFIRLNLATIPEHIEQAARAVIDEIEECGKRRT